MDKAEEADADAWMAVSRRAFSKSCAKAAFRRANSAEKVLPPPSLKHAPQYNPYDGIWCNVVLNDNPSSTPENPKKETSETVYATKDKIISSMNVRLSSKMKKTSQT